MMTKDQQRLIKRLTKKGVRQSKIARALNVTPSAIGDWQKKLGLPTRLVMDEKQVVELFENGWSVARIAARFSRCPTAIDKLLRSHRSRNAAKVRAKNEIAFRADIRLRAGSVQELAVKHDISLWNAYKIRDEIFGARRFRPGPTKEAHLPLAAATLRKPPLEPPALAVASLTAFFNRYCGGTVAPKECDAEVIATFLRFVPQGTPDYVTDALAFDLTRAVDTLRRQAQGQWIH
jgi:transposase-like protein